MDTKHYLIFVAGILSALLHLYFFNASSSIFSTTQDADQEQQLEKSKSSPPVNRVDHSPVLTTETLDFLGLFALKLKFYENIEDTQTRLTESSAIVLDFATKTIPFFRIPILPTLEIRQRSGLVECAKILDRNKLDCLDPEAHIVRKGKKVFSKRWQTQPENKLLKKFKFTITAANHNASINLGFREIRQPYVDRALRASLRRTNMIGELADYSGISKARYGYNIQGDVNFDQQNRYKCAGNVYLTFNITRPFRPLHGHKFPRYANVMRYMLEKGLLEGMILTCPDFTCKKLDPPDYTLVKESTFSIDFVRSQYFPYTYLEMKSSTLPETFVLQSIVTVKQSRKGINAPNYETALSIASHDKLLFGYTELGYGAVYEQFFNETQSGLGVEYAKIEGLPRNSVISYRSINTEDLTQRILAFFSSPSHESEAPKVFSWLHNENRTSDHVQLTIEVAKNWKQFVNAIINDPFNWFTFDSIAPIVQIGERRTEDMYGNPREYAENEYDEFISSVVVGFRILDTFHIKQKRSITRSSNKLRLLKDTKEWTLIVIAVMGYDIELDKLEVVREEQMRHCNDLPHKVISHKQDFECLPATMHIKNDSFRSLGIDTSAAARDSYIKYYTLKVHDSFDEGFIDMFPYKSRVLDEKIGSLLRANNLTELSFVKDHFRFGAHVGGKFASKRNQDNDCTFSAEIVWAINASSDVFNDNLVLVESLTHDVLREYHREGLFHRGGDHIDRLLRLFNGHLFEMTNFEIKFNSRPRTPYLSEATFITRDQFPFIYYNHHLHSHDRAAFNYTGTIRQTNHGTVYNTTYSIVSSATSPLGSFLFNRTTSSNQESQSVIADQVLFVYPHFDIWFMARSSNDTATEPKYFGKFLDGQNNTTIMSKVATNNSKTDVSFEQHSDRTNFWVVRFKMQRDVYQYLSKHMQIVNKTATSEEQYRMQLEDLLAYIENQAT